MKKHFLFLSLMMALAISALLPQAAHALTYTAIAGSSGFSGEGYSNIFDSSTSTKWCTDAIQRGSVYVLFKTQDSIRVDGYVITTANDNASNAGRNPKSWVLAASQDSVHWDTIHSVTNDRIMQNVNYTPFTFLLPTPTTKFYKFFRWTVIANQGNNCLQLSEFELLPACDHDHGFTHHDAATATCTLPGHPEYWSCNVCERAFADTLAKTVITDFDAFCNEPAHGHTFVDGVCSVCGAYASPYASAVSIRVPGASFTSKADTINAVPYDWTIVTSAVAAEYMPGIMSSNKDMHSTTSQTTMTFVTPRKALLTFDYAVSSESNYDKLSIILDGKTIVDKVSGKVGGSVSRIFSAGTHTLTALYYKDGSSSSNKDRGFLYNMVLDTLAVGAITAQQNPNATYVCPTSACCFDTVRLTDIHVNSGYFFNKFTSTPAVTWVDDSTFLMPNEAVSVEMLLYAAHTATLAQNDSILGSLSATSGYYGDTVRILGSQLTDPTYRFNRYRSSVSVSWLNDTTFLMPDSNVTITPVFFYPKAITLEANEHATLTLPATAYCGDTIRFTDLQVEEGYRWKSYTYSPSSVTTISNGFIMPDNEVSIRIDLYEKKKITLRQPRGVEVTLSDTLAFIGDTIVMHANLPEGYVMYRGETNNTLTWVNDSSFVMTNSNITLVPNVQKVNEVTVEHPFFEGFEDAASSNWAASDGTKFVQIYSGNTFMGVNHTTSVSDYRYPYEGKQVGYIYSYNSTRFSTPVRLQPGKRYIFSMYARHNGNSSTAANAAKFQVDLRNNIASLNNGSSYYLQLLVDNATVGYGPYSLVTDTFTCDSAAANSWLSIYGYGSSVSISVDNVRLEEWPADMYAVRSITDSLRLSRSLAHAGDTIVISPRYMGCRLLSVEANTTLTWLNDTTFLMPAENVLLTPDMRSYVDISFQPLEGISFALSNPYPQAGDTVSIHVSPRGIVYEKSSSQSLTWLNDTTLIVPGKHTTITYKVAVVPDISEQPLFDGFEKMSSDAVTPANGWWLVSASGSNSTNLSYYGYSDYKRSAVRGAGFCYMSTGSVNNVTIYKPVYLHAGVTYSLSYFAKTSNYTSSSNNPKTLSVIARAAKLEQNMDTLSQLFFHTTNYQQITDTFSVAVDSVYWIGLNASNSSSYSSNYICYDNVSLDIHRQHNITLNADGCDDIWSSASFAFAGDTILVRGSANANRVDCGWYAEEGVVWISDSTFLMPNYDVTIQRATILPVEPTLAQPVVENFENPKDFVIGFNDNVSTYSSSANVYLTHRPYNYVYNNTRPAYDGDNYLTYSSVSTSATLYAFRPVLLSGGVTYSFSVMAALESSSTSYTYKAALKLFSKPESKATSVTLAEEDYFTTTYKRIEGTYSFPTDTLVYLGLVINKPSTSTRMFFDLLKVEVSEQNTITCISSDSCTVTASAASATAGDTITISLTPAEGMIPCALRISTPLGTTEQVGTSFVMPNAATTVSVLCRRVFDVTADHQLVDTFSVWQNNASVNTLYENWYTPTDKNGSWVASKTSTMGVGQCAYRSSSYTPWMYRPVMLHAGESYNIEATFALSSDWTDQFIVRFVAYPDPAAPKANILSYSTNDDTQLHHVFGTYTAERDTLLWLAVTASGSASLYFDKVTIREVQTISLVADSSFLSVDLPSDVTCGDVVQISNPVYRGGEFVYYSISYNGIEEAFSGSSFVVPGYDVVLHAHCIPVSVITAETPFFDGFEADTLSPYIVAEQGWYNDLFNRSQLMSNYAHATSYSRRPYEGTEHAMLKYGTSTYIYHPVVLQQGHTYRFSLFASTDDGSATIKSYLYNKPGGTILSTIVNKSISTSGSYQEVSATFVAPSSDTIWLGLYLYNDYNGWYLSVDNICLREADKHAVTFTSNVADVVTLSSDSLYEGETFTLSVADGYIVDSIVTTPAVVHEGLTFTMPYADVHLNVYVSRKYLVTFMNYDGTVLTADSLSEGSTPDAPVAIRPCTADYTYVFTGWSPAVAPVSGDAVYTPLFDSLQNVFVTFLDYDSTVLKIDTVGYGLDAIAPDAPERDGYVFTGWSDDITAVTADITVLAQYTESTGTALGNSEADRQRPIKFIENNRILILMPDGTTFDALGRRVR